MLQSCAKKKLKVQNTMFLRQRFCGNFFLILFISLPTTKQLGKMWCRQSTNEILKRRENFKRSDIKSKIYKKTVSASQLKKIVFKILYLKFLGKLMREIVQKSS